MTPSVVGRVCLDMLRSRKARREGPLDAHVPDPIVRREVVSLYRREGLERHLDEEWFEGAAAELRSGFEKIGLPVTTV